MEAPGVTDITDLKERYPKMATKLNPAIRGLLDKFLVQFEQAILERAGSSAGRGRGRAAKGGRMCPVPGCGKASAGPRDHFKSLSRGAQDKILASASREAPRERGSARTAGAANGRRKRRGPRGPLDMKCRVEGCKNMSRGPRFGFICDEHRKSLGKKAQEEAREKYKAKKAASA
jgi:hypothetical protein